MNVSRFQELGYGWIEELDAQAILEIKENNDFSTSARDSIITDDSVEDFEIPNSQPATKKVTNVMVMYSDGTCKIYSPSEFGMQ